MANMPQNDVPPRGALELLEEAVHLLRLSPPAALASYYVGALPFVAMLLYFWADMSRSAFAAGRLAEESLILAVAFLWMKCWQGVFMRGLLAGLCGEPRPQRRWRNRFRLLVLQSIVQPWGLLLTPVATATIFAFPRIYAFYQNFCLLGDGLGESLSLHAAPEAWRQAGLWGRQNAGALLLLTLVAVFLWLNLILAATVPPMLLKTFLGIETVFSRGGFNLLNTTFMAMTLALTYLCLDPVAKAFYTLRIFYGNSLRTGQDLQVEFKRCINLKGIAIMVALAVLATAPASMAAPTNTGIPARASSSPAERPQGTVASDDLNRSISTVISRPQYTWRLPRENAPPQEQENSILKGIGEKLGEWWDKLWDRDSKKSDNSDDRRGEPSPSSSGDGWVGGIRSLLYVLLAAGLVALAILAGHVWLGRRKQTDKPASPAVTASPDLTREDVKADDLSERAWLDLAKELLARGDRRLALRAMYLSSLSLLAEASLISIAKFKSNREYLLELRRRGHDRPDIPEAFGQNVGFFEEVWYGLHDVTDAMVERFATNQERIHSLANA